MHSCATSPPGPRTAPDSAARGASRRSSRRGSRSRSPRASPLAAHHRDVHPRDRQDRRAAVRRGATGPIARRRAGAGRACAAADSDGPAGTARDAPCTRPGPTPGPPPPCGMQNVLCRLRCETSAPNWPGAARPTSAFRFAPSTYTWPPCACTISQMRPMPASNTPCVDGYVTMIAARSSRVLRAPSPRGRRGRRCRRRRTRRRRPACPPSAPTPGLVPCADDGIRQTLRCAFAAARVIRAGSSAGPRTRPASRRWAAATPRRSRCTAQSICSSSPNISR